jgi:hypothetical protein
MFVLDKLQGLASLFGPSPVEGYHNIEVLPVRIGKLVQVAFVDIVEAVE